MQRRAGRSDDGIHRSLEQFADNYDVKPIPYELLLCIENVKNWLHLSDREVQVLRFHANSIAG